MLEMLEMQKVGVEVGGGGSSAGSDRLEASAGK
jgi:hypothetical protein